MSVLVEPVTVRTIQGFALETEDPFQRVELFQLSNLESGVVETVRMTLPYGSVQPVGETFALQLVAPDLSVLWEQNTPPITRTTDSSDLDAILTWSRLGNDTAQVPAMLVDDQVSGWSRVWANMRLPELVLPAGGYVVLNSYRGVSGTENQLVVTDGIIAYSALPAGPGGSGGTGTLSPVTGAYTQGELV